MFPYQPIDKAIPVPSPNAGDFCLTFDGKWLPILLGLLQTLTYSATWENPSEGINNASLLIEAFMSAKICKEPHNGGIEMGEDCMGCCIRWSDAGILQVFACGEWQDVPGEAGRGLGNGSQPAQGAPQPAAGGCENFIGKVLFFGKWLLPVPVSAGDQISVSNALGAATDYIVDFPLWKCGDGTDFEAGGCVEGTAGFNMGDPDPSIHHGNLIGFDGTNYYDFGEAANGSTVTVTMPPGISAVNFTMMLNFAGPAGSGDNSFDIRVCKAAALPIGLTYTFGTGPSSVASGGIITVNSATDAPTVERFDMGLTECCKCEVLTNPGWATAGSSSSPYYEDCASVGHNHSGADVAPSDFLSNVNAMRLIANGALGSPFSVQIRITKL